MGTEPIREFSTTEPEPFIKIDGTAYNLRTRSGTIETLHIRDIAEEYKELVEKRGEERTEADDARIIEILIEMTNASLDAPQNIIDKLDDIQRGSIMLIVTEEIKKRRDPTAADTE